MAEHGQEKVGKVMREFKRGKLHSGSGGLVKNRKQAIAIALSEAGLSKPNKLRSASKHLRRRRGI